MIVYYTPPPAAFCFLACYQLGFAMNSYIFIIYNILHYFYECLKFQLLVVLFIHQAKKRKTLAGAVFAGVV